MDHYLLELCNHLSYVSMCSMIIILVVMLGYKYHNL